MVLGRSECLAPTTGACFSAGAAMTAKGVTDWQAFTAPQFVWFCQHQSQCLSGELWLSHEDLK